MQAAWDARFGVAGGKYPEMNSILGTSASGPPGSGAMPRFPCYGWGSGWDSTHPAWNGNTFNLFMVRPNPPDQYYSLTALRSLLSSYPGSLLIFGNEPDNIGQDNQTPAAHVTWLRGLVNDLSGYNYGLIPASISQIPDIPNWTSHSGNPYGTTNKTKERYMWDVLRYFRDQYGSELSSLAVWRNYHAYGSGNGTASSDADAAIQVLTDWYNFYASYDSSYGTSWSSMPAILTETGYPEAHGGSDTYKRDFMANYYNRLRGAEGSRAGVQRWCHFVWGNDSWSQTHFPNSQLVNSSGAEKFAGREYNALASQARCTAMLILTTTDQPVPGCSIVIPTTGQYLASATFDFHPNADGTTNDDNNYLVGSFYVAGVAQVGNALYLVNDNGPGGGQSRATLTQEWLVSLNAGATVELKARKANSTSGISRVRETHTELTIVQV